MRSLSFCGDNSRMIIFRLIANGLAPLPLIGAILACFVPGVFLGLGSVFKWLFAASTFALGVVLALAHCKITPEPVNITA